MGRNNGTAGTPSRAQGTAQPTNAAQSGVGPNAKADIMMGQTGVGSTPIGSLPSHAAPCCALQILQLCQSGHTRQRLPAAGVCERLPGAGVPRTDQRGDLGEGLAAGGGAEELSATFLQRDGRSRYAHAST